ncbi:MAG TPA: hypothetical protein VNH64_03435 [Parvularculaceae bacterium]|nr:hypothetical protein [Parvularculaceae bacterium]
MIASAAKALHFCASVVVFGSLLRAAAPTTFAAFLSRAAGSVFGAYAAARDKGLDNVGTMIASKLAVAGDHAVGFAPHWPPAFFQDAVIFVVLQIPIFFVAAKAARRIKAGINRWRDRKRDDKSAPLSLPLGLIPWRALAANGAFASAVLGLGAYYAFAYGGGLAALLALGALVDRLAL